MNVHPWDAKRALSVSSTLLAALLAWGALAACDRHERDDKPEKVDTAEATPAPVLPAEPGQHAPSFATAAEGDVANLADVETCGECHAEQAEEWGESMHSFASFNNPFYRRAFDDFDEQAGRDKTNFCAGCHDPVVMFSGDMADTIEPEQKNAHLGVTCGVCHGATEATKDGNGSFRVEPGRVHGPTGESKAAIAAHRKNMSTEKVDEDALCVSCHRGFINHRTGHAAMVTGLDEWGPWRASGYNGNPSTRIDAPVEPASCVDCHMPAGENGVASHRFPGGHTTGAAMIGSQAQLAAQRALLEDAASLDIAAVGVGDPGEAEDPDEIAAEPGDRIWFDALVRNTGTGHAFPGGVRDLRNTVVDATLRDANGEVVAKTKGGREAHRLRVMVVGNEADSRETHQVAHFRTPAFDHTISTRNAAIVRFAWEVPDDVAWPVELEARIVHRRLLDAFAEATCESSQDGRGAEFIHATEKYVGKRADPCVEQPVTIIASATARIGGNGVELPERDAALRAWERALALTAELSENLPMALASLDRAQENVDDQTPDWLRAAIRFERGRVFARQNRTEDAIPEFDAAEEIIGAHPAIELAKGRAYEKVWMFPQAVPAYRAAAELQGDDRIWRGLAYNLGSMDEHRASLEAAQKGLAIEPRDKDLLRAQLLALRGLDAPKEDVEAAAAAYDKYKADEEAPHIRIVCSDDSEVCRRERLPVHVHWLR
ncbi:MAG: multiheme c-type cytochrome [Myxococcota bacterium]